MISLEYVNGSYTRETDALCKPFELFLETSKREMDQMFAEFSIVEEKVLLESAIMGTVQEPVMMVYEEGKKNIFTKIGEAIVSIYKKLVEFIDTAIDKIKTYAFDKKSDIQKLEVLIKKHPDLKNEAIGAFNSGALDLQDVKSLKDLDSTFEEILKMAKKKDVDPNTLRGKWEKAKEKFEKDEKSWKVVKVAAATTTIISAAVAIKTLPALLVKHKNEYAKNKEDLKTREAETLAILKEKGTVNEDTGLTRLLLEITREHAGKHMDVRKGNLSLIEKMFNGITNLIDKFDKDGNAAKRYVADLEETKLRADKKDEQPSHRERMKEIRDTAYHQQAGRDAYNKQHPKKP